MASKQKLNLSSKRAKVNVRKDLFGSNNHVETDVEKRNESVLTEIWGESDNSATHSSTNSLLLSPALKRSPKRFSTSPSPKKVQGTPKKSSPSPRKLSKYSPFRKKVHNPDPKNTIKNFFNVKERNVFENRTNSFENGTNHLSLGSELECKPSTSTGISILPPNETSATQKLNTSLLSQRPEVVSANMPSISVPEHTPKKSTNNSRYLSPSSTKKTASPSPQKSFKDIYSSFLLRVVNESQEKMGPDHEKLLSDTDYANIYKFIKLDQPSQKLYARLLNRKLDWIRTSSMKYGDVQLELKLLLQIGFITSDCNDIDLETLLNLLTLPDLKALCKDYKLPESGVKNDILSRLISRAKQRSIKSFFSQSSADTCGENNLRKRIYEKLGPVIKVTRDPQETFSRCLLLFSYAHYHGLERDRFSDQLSLVSQLRDVRFPECDVVRTKVFQSRDSFLLYETALHACSKLLEAKEDKDYATVREQCGKIYKDLQNYLQDERSRSEVEATPDWLRRFTAGACWVRALSAAVDVLRKFPDSQQQAENVLQLLLGQRLFGRHRRGSWYEQLALLYQHNLRDNVKASHAILRGLRDEYIDSVSRHVLGARSVMLEKRKTNGLKDYLKDTLATQRTQALETLEEPPEVTITEQALSSNRTGRKMVYVQDVEEGKMLSSVEEVAIEHFRQQGYTYGVHDEGSIMRSVVFVCFWDEIYGQAVVDGHGMFHSPYQTTPLDWNSESFYERRKEKIKSKLQDLAEGEMESVLHLFQFCYLKNFGVESVVNWKFLENLPAVESFIRCLNIDVFLALSRLLLRHHKTYGAGFPDLTLWNPDEKKCLFVEVKSPNDQLSMKQRVWISMLNKMGAQALVCHVQSIGCKSLKRKSGGSPTKD